MPNTRPEAAPGPHRRAQAQWQAAGAFLAVALGQANVHLNPPAIDGPLLLLAGILLFWRAVRGHELPAICRPRPASAHSRPSIGLTAGWVVLVAALTVLAVLTTIRPAPWLPPQLVAVLLAASWIGLGVWLDGGVGRPGIMMRLRSLARWEWVLGGAIIATGLLVRLYRLDSLPAGLWFDEATAGLEARAILSDPGFRPVYSPATMSAAGYVYLVAAAEAVFGQTVGAIRLVPAVAGALTPVFAWIVARRLLGPVAGIAACGLMAFARWDINFSRIGMQSSTTPLLILAAFALLLYALFTNRWSLYAALGVVMGTLVWFYAANLAFPLVIVVVLATMGRQVRATRAQFAMRLAFAALCGLSIAVPVATFAAVNPDAVIAHPASLLLLQTTPIDRVPSVVAESGLKHLMMFNLAGDHNGRHNLPGAPMLDDVTGALFLLGIVAALRHWRDPRSVLAIVWTLVMLLPGVLSAPYEAPQSLRSIGALPGAVLLATMGIWWLWRLLSGGKVTAATLPSLVAVLAAVLILNVGVYFGPQARDDAVWRSFSMAQTIVGREMARSGAASSTIATDHFAGQPVVRFLTGAEPVAMKTGDLPVHGNGLSVTVYLDPLDRGYYELVKSYYPTADCEDYRSAPDAAPVLHRCTVSPEQQAAVSGLRVRYFDNESGLTAPVFETTATSGAIPPLPPGRPGSYRVLVEGSLLAPEYGEYRLALQGPPPAQLYLDENLELSAGNTSVSRQLAAGLHRVALLSQVSGGSAPGRLLWQPPGASLAEIPPRFLFHGAVEAQGLKGSYHAGSNFGEGLRFQRVDPTSHLYFQTLPLDLPFRVEWTGSLLVQEQGPHRFFLESINQATVMIDGKQVVSTGPSPESEVSVAVPLERGWHAVAIRLAADTGYAHIYLRWQPPGARRPELLPPLLMRPW